MVVKMFLSMVGTAMTVLVVVVVVTLIVEQIYSSISERQRKKAVNYLLERTRECYFHGYPLADCLQAGIVGDLYRRKVGDYAKQVGVLVLSTLKELSETPRVYCHWQEPFGDMPGRFRAILVYNYGGKWWRFDLLNPELDPWYLIQVKPSRQKGDGADGDLKFPDFDDDWEYLTYWGLEKSQRQILDGCTDPKKSDLMPNVQYAEAASRSDYADLAHAEIAKIMELWYFRR